MEGGKSSEIEDIVSKMNEPHQSFQKKNLIPDEEEGKKVRSSLLLRTLFR